MLSSYRVLDLTDDRGMVAGFILAALGAEVIAIEPPGGNRVHRLGPFAGDESLWHLAYNRNKLSVTLDRVDLAELAATADVVLDSGAIDVDLDRLRNENQALVTVSITPFGPRGPKAGWAATDITVVAAAGPLAMTGDDDRPPVRMSVPQAWMHAGSDAACGALLALAERAHSGQGQHVDISAQISVAQATQSYILSTPFHATTLERYAGGVRLGPTRLPLVFPAKDGHVAITFLFGSAIGPFTARLMEWIDSEGGGSPSTKNVDWIGFGGELLTGKVTPDLWEEILGTVAAFTSQRTKAELLADALSRRLLVAPVATPQDVMDSEHFQARDYWETAECDGAEIRFPGRFAKLTGTPLPPLRPAPTIGQHNGSIVARAKPDTPQRPAQERQLPLAGVKVLDLMWVMAGPAVTRVMADFGADVVRVESNRFIETARTIQPFWRDQIGVEVSALYQNMNAGKRNISVDLSTLDGREVIADLIRWADVVTEAFTPGVMAGWGLDYDNVRRINPDVVMLSTCLMGQTGPLNRYAGYGNLAAALCGFTNLVGWPDRPPAGPFGAYSDYIAPRFALATLLAALDHRSRTGEGQYIDFSQAEAALHFLAPALLEYELTSRLPERAGNDDRHMAPHGVYPAAGDDRWVAIACETDEQWRALSDVIGRSDLSALAASDRLDRRRELDEAIKSWTAARPEAEIVEALQRRNVPAHVVQNSPECTVDPQLLALGHLVTTEHAEFGEVQVEGPRCFLSATPGQVGPPPTLGQHLFDVLQDVLGYDEDRIAELLVSGALE